MRTVPRTRRYIPNRTLTLCRPLLAFDYRREAYVLRGVGGRYGPVVRPDRRQAREDGYPGPERRDAASARRDQAGATMARG